ncbi:MAG: CcoQ/FixQ family Cbb3-type cytochrome c oxidase assembly chaperone [Bacteroidota bacterium]
MFKYILESAGNINWMAIASLLTFFTVFTVSAVLAFKQDKTFINKMANLPLEEDQPK